MDSAMYSLEGRPAGGQWCGSQLVSFPLRKMGIVFSFAPLRRDDLTLTALANGQATLFYNFLRSQGYVAIVQPFDEASCIAEGFIVVRRDDCSHADVRVVIGPTQARILTETRRHCLIAKGGVCHVPRPGGQWVMLEDGAPSMTVPFDGRPDTLLKSLACLLTWYSVATGKLPAHKFLNETAASFREKHRSVRQ